MNHRNRKRNYKEIYRYCHNKQAICLQLIGNLQ